MRDDLWRWDATTLADAIRTRQISSREAVASAIGRLEAVNPHINAVVDVLSDEALAGAAEADRRLALGEPNGALHGVPVTIKINVDYAGRATTNGVAAFRDRIAKADNPCIARWRKAGAIVLGRTNVPPFSARYFTDCELYGRTLNPWSSAHTPGGSSGGAAAALATGIGALAHGNDRAGSIRYPAYACGVMGLRATLGRVPNFDATNPTEPSIATQFTNVQGPLARSVRDLRLGFAAMAGHDPEDPWSIVPQSDNLSPPQDTPVAIFVPHGGEVDHAVTDAVQMAARWLADAGHPVEEAAPPHFREAAELFFTLIRSEETTGTSRAIESFGDAALRRARASTMATARELDYAGYIQAIGRRAAILRDWQRFLLRYPLLLMPVSCERPFPVDLDQCGDAVVRRLIAAQHPMLAVSMLGLPAIAVPTNLVDGLPLGVQLVASRFREDLCFMAAEQIEQRAGFRTPIDPRE